MSMFADEMAKLQDAFKKPTWLDRVLTDANLTRAEWFSLDEQAQRAYWRLFGPSAPQNCSGDCDNASNQIDVNDYDGDQGRNWKMDRGIG